MRGAGGATGLQQLHRGKSGTRSCRPIQETTADLVSASPTCTLLQIKPDVSTAKPRQEGHAEMNGDRNASVNIPKEVLFTLSQFTINGNGQFNANPYSKKPTRNVQFNGDYKAEFTLLWMHFQL